MRYVKEFTGDLMCKMPRKILQLLDPSSSGMRNILPKN